MSVTWQRWYAAAANTPAGSGKRAFDRLSADIQDRIAAVSRAMGQLRDAAEHELEAVRKRLKAKRKQPARPKVR